MAEQIQAMLADTLCPGACAFYRSFLHRTLLLLRHWREVDRSGTPGGGGGRELWRPAERFSWSGFEMRFACGFR